MVVAAFAVVAVAVAVFVFFGLRRGDVADDDAPNKAVTIKQRIEIMYDAAQDGDVDRYLECFTDPMRSRLESPGSRLSAATLRNSESDLNGLIFPVKSVPSEGDEASVVIVKRYTEHNERVRLRMKRIDGDWKIAEIEGLDKQSPKTRYGTPVVPNLAPKKSRPKKSR